MGKDYRPRLNEQEYQLLQKIRDKGADFVEDQVHTLEDACENMGKEANRLGNVRIEWVDGELLMESFNAKVCTKCDEFKPFDKFYKQKIGKCGFRSRCKVCEIKQAKKYYKNNKEEQKKYTKQYYKQNKETIYNRYRVKYILTNSIKRNYEEFRDKLNQAKFCNKCEEYKSFNEFYTFRKGKYNLHSYCKSCKKELWDEWYEKNPDYNKIYRDANRKRLCKKRNIRRKKRFKNDVGFKLKYNIQARIRAALKNNYKSKSSIKLLGCSIQKLKKHLEDQFEGDMSWDNHGIYGWHIDHIIPCASYDLSKPSHQEECFHYSNLQPLWAEDNLKKHDKVI